MRLIGQELIIHQPEEAWGGGQTFREYRPITWYEYNKY